jgi:hypothetical protein
MDEPYREAAVVTLSPSKRYCHACANINDVRAELCPRCGIRQPATPGMQSTTALSVREPRQLALTVRNVIIARAFALSLGGVGIYLFASNYLAAAIACLVVFWGFIRTFGRSSTWEASSPDESYRSSGRG